MRYLLLPFFLLLTLSCMEEIPEKQASKPRPPEKIEEKKKLVTEELFSDRLANSFVFPFEKDGDQAYMKKWRLTASTGQPGENWQFTGTEETAPVFSIAKGEVILAMNTGKNEYAVEIKHEYVENASIKTVISSYDHLKKMHVKKGEQVAKGQLIGSFRHDSAVSCFYFTVRENVLPESPSTRLEKEEILISGDNKGSVSPSAFIKKHRQTYTPKGKALLLIAVKHEYKMYVYKSGKLSKTYDIALSQSPVGHKQEEGDNKLPEGEYKIIQKTKGPFAGDYSEYLGSRFMRLNYPNSYDAENALKNKKITAKQAEQIISANANNKEPNKHTGLGGGIGIHGWAGDWPLNSKHLTWGCISMKNTDLPVLFDEVPLFTPILIFP
ncbi:MAG: hypothetical protein K0S33_3488 [Bacteroidetes bacterium]|jgi:hypothetical protein|nr:hypothetical protein [Bacteroidota bacterium]